MNRRSSNRTNLSTQVLFLTFVTLILCTTAMGDLTWKITQLTDNETPDTNPDISGTNVVWQGWDGSDWQIYSNFAGQLSSTGGGQPAISGTNVVWGNGHDFQIHSNFAGQLTHNSDAMYPDISGTNVVWMAWEDDHSDIEIYSNFAGQLTFNGTDDRFPAISGTHVVWGRGDGSDAQVYSSLYGPLSSGTTYNGGAAVSGTNVVWSGLDGSDYNLYSNFDGPLTDVDGRSEGSPDIDGTNVVWSDSGDYIYTNFGGKLPTISTLNDNPAISGTTIVWEGWDGHDSEIYMAELAPVPLPGAALLGVFGLASAGQKLRKHA